MAPDAEKDRQVVAPRYLDDESVDQIRNKTGEVVSSEDPIVEGESLEVSFRQALNDFSYIERPIRCILTCRSMNKSISCNGKNGVFLSSHDTTSGTMDEFTLMQDEEGVVILQSTKHNRLLCSNDSGVVYAAKKPNEDLEKWILTAAEGNSGFYITSLVTQKKLTCFEKSVCTLSEPSLDTKSHNIWSVDLTSGELCFLSLPKLGMRLRCDFSGNLSFSKNYLGWEAWRLSEVGDGYVRISPWAHSNIFLSSDPKGKVYATECRGPFEKWSVEKTRDGSGLLIKSANTGRILCQRGLKEDPLCTIAEPSNSIKSSCVWNLESLHRNDYYLVCTASNKKRLEVNKRGTIGTRSFPLRITSEEWKIQPTGENGIVTLFSNGSEKYLASSEDGEVFLLNKLDGSGSELWMVEERTDGNAIVSQNSQRVLVSPQRGAVCTVLPGTAVTGTTRWTLEPKLPRQVSKEKMQAVGAAVAIGVATTVATPFLIGGAIGIIGITQVGVAGQVAIGGVRAAEALSTITRLTVSSTQLMWSQPSMIKGAGDETIEGTPESKLIDNRPFSAWKTW